MVKRSIAKADIAELSAALDSDVIEEKAHHLIIVSTNKVLSTTQFKQMFYSRGDDFFQIANTYECFDSASSIYSSVWGIDCSDPHAPSLENAEGLVHMGHNRLAGEGGIGSSYLCYNFNKLGGRENDPSGVAWAYSYAHDQSRNFYAQKEVIGYLEKDTCVKRDSWTQCSRMSIEDQLYGLAFASETDQDLCMEVTCARRWSEVEDALAESCAAADKLISNVRFTTVFTGTTWNLSAGAVLIITSSRRHILTAVITSGSDLAALQTAINNAGVLNGYSVQLDATTGELTVIATGSHAVGQGPIKLSGTAVTSIGTRKTSLTSGGNVDLYINIRISNGHPKTIDTILRVRFTIGYTFHEPSPLNTWNTRASKAGSGVIQTGVVRDAPEGGKEQHEDTTVIRCPTPPNFTVSSTGLMPDEIHFNPGTLDFGEQEEGKKMEFQVVLNEEPDSTINFILTLQSEYVSPAINITPPTWNTLSFTTQNWNTPQKIQIEIPDDNLVNFPHNSVSATPPGNPTPEKIIIHLESSQCGWNSVDYPDQIDDQIVTVTPINDDFALYHVESLVRPGLNWTKGDDLDFGTWCAPEDNTSVIAELRIRLEYPPLINPPTTFTITVGKANQPDFSDWVQNIAPFDVEIWTESTPSWNPNTNTQTFGATDFSATEGDGKLIKFRAIDDNYVEEPDENFVVKIKATSGDTNYMSLVPDASYVKLCIDSDDVPGFFVKAVGGMLAETTTTHLKLIEDGDHGDFEVWLGAAPDPGDVVEISHHVIYDDSTGHDHSATGYPLPEDKFTRSTTGVLTFDSGDWNTHKKITIEPVNNNQNDPDEQFRVIFWISAANDTAWNPSASTPGWPGLTPYPLATTDAKGRLCTVYNKPTCTDGIDCVFIFDYTGSMTDQIQAAKEGVADVADYVSHFTRPDGYRFSLVTYSEQHSFWDSDWHDDYAAGENPAGGSNDTPIAKWLHLEDYAVSNIPAAADDSDSDDAWVGLSYKDLPLKQRIREMGDYIPNWKMSQSAANGTHHGGGGALGAEYRNIAHTTCWWRLNQGGLDADNPGLGNLIGFKRAVQNMYRDNDGGGVSSDDENDATNPGEGQGTGGDTVNNPDMPMGDCTDTHSYAEGFNDQNHPHSLCGRSEGTGVAIDEVIRSRYKWSHADYDNALARPWNFGENMQRPGYENNVDLAAVLAEAADAERNKDGDRTHNNAYNSSTGNAWGPNGRMVKNYGSKRFIGPGGFGAQSPFHGSQAGNRYWIAGNNMSVWNGNKSGGNTRWHGGHESGGSIVVKHDGVFYDNDNANGGGRRRPIVWIENSDPCKVWVDPAPPVADTNGAQPTKDHAWALTPGQRIQIAGVEGMTQINGTKDDAKTITNITNANLAVCTTSGNHGYSNGDKVFIKGVIGMNNGGGTEWPNNLNSKKGTPVFIITVTSTTQFSLQNAADNVDVNTTGWTAYGGGGTVQSTYNQNHPNPNGVYRIKETGTGEPPGGGPFPPTPPPTDHVWFTLMERGLYQIHGGTPNVDPDGDPLQSGINSHMPDDPIVQGLDHTNGDLSGNINSTSWTPYITSGDPTANDTWDWFTASPARNTHDFIGTDWTSNPFLQGGSGSHARIVVMFTDAPPGGFWDVFDSSCNKGGTNTTINPNSEDHPSPANKNADWDTTDPGGSSSWNNADNRKDVSAPFNDSDSDTQYPRPYVGHGGDNSLPSPLLGTGPTDGTASPGGPHAPYPYRDSDNIHRAADNSKRYVGRVDRHWEQIAVTAISKGIHLCVVDRHDNPGYHQHLDDRDEVPQGGGVYDWICPRTGGKYVQEGLPSNGTAFVEKITNLIDELCPTFRILGCDPGPPPGSPCSSTVWKYGSEYEINNGSTGELWVALRTPALDPSEVIIDVTANNPPITSWSGSAGVAITGGRRLTFTDADVYQKIMFTASGPNAPPPPPAPPLDQLKFEVNASQTTDIRFAHAAPQIVQLDISA